MPCSCFQCKKLDSWESLQRLITLNKTVGNITNQNYSKVSDSSLTCLYRVSLVKYLQKTVNKSEIAGSGFFSHDKALGKLRL